MRAWMTRRAHGRLGAHVPVLPTRGFLPVSCAQAVETRAPAGGCVFRLVHDCHFAVLSPDDLHACRLGRGVRVDGDARLGRTVGAHFGWPCEACLG